MFSEFWTVFSTNALKFFFLYTPFFALSMFLCITEEMEERERRRLSGRVMSAAFFVSAASAAASSRFSAASPGWFSPLSPRSSFFQAFPVS